MFGKRVGLWMIAVIFLALMVWVMYTFVTSKYPGANDFAQRWNGAKAFWVDHLNPYSKEVTNQAELMLYGAPASTDPALDQYPGDFLYPFHTIIVLTPLAFMPYALAEACWLVVIGVCVALTFILLANLFNWRRPLWLSVVGVMWAMLFYPAARGLFLGQIGVVVVCLEIITIWALVKNQDILAGVLLVVSTIKPQIGFLIIPFLLLYALRFNRWRFLISFMTTSVILMALSFILLPSWLTQWLAQVSQYAGYTKIGSPVWVITNVYVPFLDGPGEAIIDGLLIVFMLWGWWPVLRNKAADHFVWAAALTLVITHLVAVRTATPHFVAYLIVVVPWFKAIMKANRRRGALVVAGLMLILLVGLWVLFLTTLYGTRFEHPINYLPLPLIGLTLIWVMRRQWWSESLAKKAA